MEHRWTFLIALLIGLRKNGILQKYQIDKQSKFITLLKQAVFTKGDIFLLEHTVTRIKLPSRKLTTLTTNDFEDYISGFLGLGNCAVGLNNHFGTVDAWVGHMTNGVKTYVTVAFSDKNRLFVRNSVPWHCQQTNTAANDNNQPQRQRPSRSFK